ncbi:ectonucleotide pyrophosphatase/phosphodiesterase family member 6-like isoform X1 [Dinothrombium tinctorium]|uniref:glycerophosphocholine cholinephosphodiesterase n=1 Tax=Dinothrombium tinctorium TaxID=1965070 RepID=A0A3S3P7M0_9ACAR|nr:ectonucleotide pyrophosphatase/phosphodiesterase family member 6-like isoform X1 [Dinothrombium tinctorium]
MPYFFGSISIESHSKDSDVGVLEAKTVFQNEHGKIQSFIYEKDDIKETTTRANSDETSEDEDSNPETEEEGDSKSASEEKCKTKGNKSDGTDCRSDEVDEDEEKRVTKPTESIEDSAPIKYEICGTKEVECKKLLIILAAGMRHDYFDREKRLTAFPRIKEQGVVIDQVKPVFPSNTFPNLYSLVTGLYPEDHGVINDYFYDKKHKVAFTPEHYSHANWWKKAEPIWVTAKKRKAVVYWWPGCELEINGRPFKCTPYKDIGDKSDEVVERLKEIVENFKEDKYSLAMMYYDPIDRQGEEAGPNSKQTRRAVRKFDKILQQLLEKIEYEKIADEMNVIVVSDHGMTEKKEIIKLEDHVDENDIEIIAGDGAFVMILPEKGRETKVYEQLRQANVKGLNVYLRKKLKDEFHLKKSRLLLPIILTTDEGYLIETPNIKGTTFPVEEVEEKEGHHGFDPEEEPDMNTFAFAFGPDFKQNYTLESADQIDFYDLFLHLLGMKEDNNLELKKLLASSVSSEESSEEPPTTETEAPEPSEAASTGDNIGSLVKSSFDLIFASLIARYLL